MKRGKPLKRKTRLRPKSEKRKALDVKRREFVREQYRAQGNDPRAHTGGGDDVVAARVTDPGQGVHLRTDTDRERTASVLGHERGLEPGDTGRDGEAGVAERVDAHRGGVLLFERELGMLPQLVGDGRENAARRVHVGECAGLHRFDGHGPIVDRAHHRPHRVGLCLCPRPFPTSPRSTCSCR